MKIFWHGVQKLFGFPPATHGTIPAFITYVAGPIELIGGALGIIDAVATT